MTVPYLYVLAARINSYHGGPVVREQVEQVLDFNILLEPWEPGDPDADRMYAARTQKWRDTINTGNEIVRQYGRQFQSLDTMQREFYSFTNSTKYRASVYSISVARTVLSAAWEGINGWRE